MAQNRQKAESNILSLRIGKTGNEPDPKLKPVQAFPQT